MEQSPCNFQVLALLEGVGFTAKTQIAPRPSEQKSILSRMHNNTFQAANHTRWCASQSHLAFEVCKIEARARTSFDIQDRIKLIEGQKTGIPTKILGWPELDVEVALHTSFASVRWVQHPR